MSRQRSHVNTTHHQFGLQQRPIALSVQQEVDTKGKETDASMRGSVTLGCVRVNAYNQIRRVAGLWMLTCLRGRCTLHINLASCVWR